MPVRSHLLRSCEAYYGKAELTEQLSMSQPKVSSHLALLRCLSILLDQGQGQWVYYRFNPALRLWTKQRLSIISSQSDEIMNRQNIDSSVSLHCE